MTDAARPQLRRRAGVRHRAVRRALPPPARARHLHRAVAVRVRCSSRSPTRTTTSTAPWRPSVTSSRQLTSGRRSPPSAAAECPLWGERCAASRARASRSSRRSPTSASRSGSRRSTRATSSTTAEPRLFAPADDDTALLLGDYLYAHGLVRDRRRRPSVDAVARPRRADLPLRAARAPRSAPATAPPGRRRPRCSGGRARRRRARRSARRTRRAARARAARAARWRRGRRAALARHAGRVR